MAIITNNISGSTNDGSKIGITGSVIISNSNEEQFPPLGNDTVFFVSGSENSKSVFGGATKVSGSLSTEGNVTLGNSSDDVITVSGLSTFYMPATFNAGLSGSLTRLIDNSPYLVAGNNVVIFTGSNGSVTISGTASGDVIGPSSSTDNAIARFDLTSGKLIQNSLTTISDLGTITTSGDIAINGGNITTAASTFNLVNESSTINLGSTTVTRTINIGTNSTNVQTINVGNGNAANTISIGSNSASSTIINGGSTLSLYANAGTITVDSTGGSINVGTFGYAQTISIGNSTGATSIGLTSGTGRITLNSADVGTWASNSSYAVFKHKDSVSGTEYALIQNGNGATFLNAASGQGLYLRNNNSTKVQIDSTGVGFFGVTPVARQTGGAATADLTYSSNERDMLNSVYTALRNYGLLT